MDTTTTLSRLRQGRQNVVFDLLRKCNYHQDTLFHIQENEMAGNGKRPTKKMKTGGKKKC